MEKIGNPEKYIYIPRLDRLVGNTIFLILLKHAFSLPFFGRSLIARCILGFTLPTPRCERKTEA